MTQQVTIEGSIMPSDQLARGERRTVALTPKIQRLIDRGFVVVIDGHAGDAPEPDGGHPTITKVAGEPGKNESREKWAAFLDGQSVEYVDTDKRDDLVAIWQARRQA